MGALRSLQLSPQSINRDAPPTRLGVEGQSEWSYGKNVRFVAQAGYSAAGEAPTYSGLPYIALWARWGIQRGVPVVFYVGTTYIGCYDGAHHNLTPAGWHRVMRPEDVTGIVFNDFAVINALPNAPIYIPLSHDVANPLPGWDATWTCAGIASFKSFLVALGAMTPNPGFQYSTVRWSASADPGTLPGEWVATPTNDAGLLEATQTPGQLIAACALGDDQLALYKAQACFALSFVGGPYVNGLRLLTGIPGALGPHAVYSLGQQNLVLTLGDLVLHNGIQRKSLLEGRARKYLFNTIDPAYFARCYIAEDLEREEINVAYPVVGSNGALVEALIWNRESDEISFRDLTRSNCIFASQVGIYRGLWSDASEAESWQLAVDRWSDQASSGSGLAVLSCAADSAQFLVLDAGTTIAGIPAVATLERMGIPMLPDGRRALLKRVQPRINGRTGDTVTVRIGVHDAAGDAVAWEPDRTFTIGVSDWLDCMSSGRYAAVHVESVNPYSLEGFRLDFSEQGRV